MYCSIVTFELFVINFSTEQHRRILKDGEDEPEHGICNLCLIDAMQLVKVTSCICIKEFSYNVHIDDTEESKLIHIEERRRDLHLVTQKTQVEQRE